MEQELLAANVFGAIGAVLLALLILLGMITVHEFGHYLAGKFFRFKINEFSIGFGPALFKKRKKDGVLFSVRAIPLGGYCAFEGEEGAAVHPCAFYKKKPWQRILVLVAGALMNYLLALVLLLVSFFGFGQLFVMAQRVDGAETTQGGIPLAGFSLADGDILLACEGRELYLTADLMEALAGKKEGDLVTFTVSRRTEEGRATVPVRVMLRADAAFADLTDTAALWRALGIAATQTEGGAVYAVASAPVRFGFFETFGRGVAYSFRIGGSIFKVLGQLLTGDLGLSAFGGPITTIRVTSQVASRGVQQFLEIAAYIGVNLAVFNLLPVPALDGSKIVFTLIEWIRGKPVNRRAEAIIHAVGFVLLLGFAVLADLLQLF